MSDATARDVILAAVRAARPLGGAPPGARVSHRAADADPALCAEAFASAAVAAGAVVVRCARSEVARTVYGIAKAPRVLSRVAGVPSNVTIPADPHALAELNLFACEASLGVAESGAVWIGTSDAWHRAALFLAERVVVVVDARNIVTDLHDAYTRIDVRAKSFGVFIAGPSKTADIEQALVVGAHGPRELSVVVASGDSAMKA